jgi:hypothetical protein
MTKEEAINEIEKVFEPAFANYIIKALEQQPITDVSSNVLHKIAEFFSNWDGDENAKMEISVEDMREISSMFVTKCRVESKLKALEQEPFKCEETISKSEALKIINSWRGIDPTAYTHIYSEIDCLPSVTPQSKKGHWISYWDEEARCYVYKCPECGNKQPFDTKCCWECGTRLVEPQESEVQDASSD